jgi:type IV fimbrial biogenesis protein FimT
MAMPTVKLLLGPTPPARPRCPARRGMTLIELMVGLSILAIALAMAAPSFTQWGRSTRVVTQGADIQNALAYARSESLRRGVRVTICSSTDPRAATPACSSSAAWASGWLVFVDNVQVTGNVAGTLDGADTVLRIGDAMTGSTVTADGNLGAWIAHTPQGLLRTAGGAAAGSLRVCNAPYARRVTVNAAGHAVSAAETCT